jgi:hypothetical protein
VTFLHDSTRGQWHDTPRVDRICDSTQLDWERREQENGRMQKPGWFYRSNREQAGARERGTLLLLPCSLRCCC